MDAFDILRERDLAERSFHRATQIVSRVTLKLADDSKPYQLHQTEGYKTEIRNNVQRIQEFGFSTMPLPGSKGLVVFDRAHRGYASIVGTEDGRYRVRNQKPGEFSLYVVTGADAKGENGTMRPILKGTVNGNGVLTGLEIDIGDSNTTDIKLKASHKVTITAPEVDISNGGTLQAVKLADGSNSTVLKAQ